ncbi:MAG: FmdB family zinc ribbon protein [Burkholderiaceae bacterium]
MPIYAYRCTSCGHAKDVLQKISDPALTMCPSCGAATFAKQLTAAGFQLKGSGWYATDFKGGGTKPSDGEKPKTEGDKAPEPAKAAKPDVAKPDSGKSGGNGGAGGKSDATAPKAAAGAR